MTGAPPPDPGPDRNFEELLGRALEDVEVEGPAAIDRICSAHPAQAPKLRARIAELRDFGLLAGDDTPRIVDAAADSPDSVSRIGPYRIVGQLGTGGMGIVYLAHDERLGRDVALKTLHARLQDNPRARQRFDREVRAISTLTHPHIVPVLDAGEWRGSPFYTMEFVRGCTLARVLDRLRGLGVPPEELTAADLQRCARPDAESGDGDGPPPSAWGDRFVDIVARWMADICRALHTAHRQGTLHRDVKPSNILVTLDGDVRLFDFGLALGADEASLTMTGDFVGTPYYASPEQATGRTAAIDARSDVYSIGATLYELLSLRKPFTGPDSRAVLRAIETRDPTPPRQWNPAVPKDLETIALTALEKPPARRYASASAMAEDLSRFLDQRRVHAKPPRAAARAWRTVRRNPVPALLTVLGVLLLVAIPIGLAISYFQIDASHRAASSLAGLLEETLLEADYEEMGKDARALDLLLHAARRAPQRLADQPVEQARLLMKIGSVCSGFDEFEPAERLLGQALALQTRTLGPDHAALAETHNHLGVVYHSTSRLALAETSYRRAMQISRDADDRALQHIAMSNLASLLNRQRRLDEAETVVRDLLASIESEPDASPDAILNARMRWTWIAVLRRDFDAARERIEPIERWLAGNPTAAPTDRMNAHALLGEVAHNNGDYDRSLAHFSAQLDLAQELGGETSSVTGMAILNVGRARFRAERFREAIVQYRKARDCLARAYASYPDHPVLAAARVLIGEAMLAKGDDADAERELRGAIADYGEGAPGHEVPLANARRLLGRILAGRPGAETEAAELLNAAGDRYESFYGAQAEETRECRRLLGSLGRPQPNTPPRKTQKPL